MYSLLFYLFVVSASLVNVSSGDENDNERFVEFIDEDGVTHLIDTLAGPATINETEISALNSKYLLFTRHNPNEAQYLVNEDPDSIMMSDFDPDLVTVVVVHGWLANSNSTIIKAIKEPLLEESNVNVIVVDWKEIAGFEYSIAVACVPTVGLKLGEFLEYLVKLTGSSYSNFHLVGHSLGAHLSGIAGRKLDRKVSRITGLDPAGPLWSNNVNSMTPTDAIYVEAIHTNNQVLGLPKLLGDVDFFPNGGQIQPGCILPVCSHSRSWELFGATIKYNNLIGYKCSSRFSMFLNQCSNSTLLMGNNDIRKSGSGIYRVETGKTYPYDPSQ